MELHQPNDQHIHDQVLSTLPSIGIPKEIRGIYFLIRNGRVVYVGQTTHLIQRIASHVAERSKAFDAVRYLELPTQNLNAVESEMIWRLNPEYNGKRSRAKRPQKYQSINRHILTKTASARGSEY